MAIAAFVVSVLALAISGLTYWRQARLADIEEARHALEVAQRTRAAVDVRTEPVATDSHMVVVSNGGPADAHGVTVDLAPRGPGEAPGLSNSPFPATIEAGAETSAGLDESLATATLLAATLRWTDGSGVQTRRVDLTID